MALAGILKVISRSRGDEAPVFDAILEAAARLCAAPFAGLWLTDAGGRGVDLVASRGARAEYLAATSRTWSLDGDASVPRAIRSRAPVQVADLKDTEAYARGDRQRVEAVDIEGIRSFLAVPLLQDGTAIGTIGLYRREVAPFGAAQIALIEAFADQAVIAMENVRQMRELQSRLEREAATREILGVISRSRDDETPVFATVLRNAVRLCHADTAGLMMGRAGQPELRLVMYEAGDRAQSPEEIAGLEAARATVMEMDPDRHISARAILSGEVVHVEDLSRHPSYLAGEPTMRTMVDLSGHRTMLSVPLLDESGALGAINLQRQRAAPFSDDEIELIRGFADQAVIAIGNVRQFRQLQDRTEEVETQAEQLRRLNDTLEVRVADQVGEIERMARLKRFLSPAVADAVVSAGDESLLGSHRAFIAVLFCDMRGFTAFCETAEPEETIEVLQTYYAEMGRLIDAHGAGVDTRSGDGFMVIMGDPLPCADPAGDAVRLAMAMRARMEELAQGWKRMGFDLGFGAGIALGYATVGMVGSEGRSDYTASGTTVNLAARLCDRAGDGEILLSPRAFAAIEGRIGAESHETVELKGIRGAIELFRVTGAAPGG